MIEHNFQVGVYIDEIHTPTLVVNMSAIDAQHATDKVENILYEQGFQFVCCRVIEPTTSSLVEVLKDIATPLRQQQFVIEQVSPLTYRITIDSLTRGTHDLAGVIRWVLWARNASCMSVAVKQGIETVNIFTND